MAMDKQVYSKGFSGSELQHVHLPPEQDIEERCCGPEQVKEIIRAGCCGHTREEG